MKRWLYIVTMACLISFNSSCSRIEKQGISILYPNWAEGVAVSYLAKIALEEQGYVVTLKTIEPGPIYAALSKGDADICMDTWLPNTQKHYWSKYGARLEIIGTVFEDGIIGLTVPSYVDIDSITQLNSIADQSNGKIYGISSGSTIYLTTLLAIDQYQLEYELISSSETSMMAVLKKMMAEKKAIVITGWKPHYMWSEYSLKMLKDPKSIYSSDQIKIVSRKGFASDNPKLAVFIQHFTLDETLLNELMNNVQENDDPQIGARKFYLAHQTLIDGWF